MSTLEVFSIKTKFVKSVIGILVATVVTSDLSATHASGDWEPFIAMVSPEPEKVRATVQTDIKFKMFEEALFVQRFKNLRTFEEWKRAVDELATLPEGNQKVRRKWALVQAALLRSEEWTSSPFAVEKRDAIALVAWLMETPGLTLAQHPEIHAQIYSGWILPNVGAAVSEPTNALSRTRLLWRAQEIFLSSRRKDDGMNLLRAVTAVAQEEHLNIADGARYMLANEMYAQGQHEEAENLLREITHDSTKIGAQKLLDEWNKVHNKKN